MIAKNIQKQIRKDIIEPPNEYFVCGEMEELLWFAVVMGIKQSCSLERRLGPISHLVGDVDIHVHVQ